jgi:hypothetical protein
VILLVRVMEDQGHAEWMFGSDFRWEEVSDVNKLTLRTSHLVHTAGNVGLLVCCLKIWGETGEGWGFVTLQSCCCRI